MVPGRKPRLHQRLSQAQAWPARGAEESFKSGRTSLIEQASAYLSLCQHNYQEETLREAARAGSALMLSAGSFSGAVEALREARLQEKGNLLQAVCDGKIRGLTALHEAYLREMALEGIPSRRSDKPARTEAKKTRFGAWV